MQNFIRYREGKISYHINLNCLKSNVCFKQIPIIFLFYFVIRNQYHFKLLKSIEKWSSCGYFKVEKVKVVLCFENILELPPSRNSKLYYRKMNITLFMRVFITIKKQLKSIKSNKKGLSCIYFKVEKV